MQVLQSKDFVPNKTLQRLIQIWHESVRVESVAAVVSRERVRDLIEEMKSRGDKWWELLEIIVCFARESDENREFLGRSEGFVDVMIDFLANCNADDARLEIVVVALNLVLSKIKEGRERISSLMLKTNCMAPLLNILRNGSEESVISSIKTLEFIAFDAESKLTIAENHQSIITELIKFIDVSTNSELIESSLSCLISISTVKRAKSKVIQLQQKNLIGGLLRNLKSEETPNISITEKSLKLLETASTVKEGRTEICKDSRCVKAVVQKLMKVSGSATEHAVTIMWSLCYLFRDQMAQEEVIKSNGLTKILVVMQSNCSPAVRQMCKDLLKIFRVNSKSCLSSYDTNTTHIMPF
ncbi:hypothetical protein ACFE04_017774 [Oxalis oulophora]